ncbi:NINE protein [Planococcaceae bacterium Storch 2/2-2]|nr:NINE protein [Planococcaceae bacterium Storch 2/2-2]
MMKTEKKSFGMALIIWFFTGGFGGHKVYLEEKFSYILWYWLLTIVTFGIAPLVGVFFIKTRIIQINHEIDQIQGSRPTPPPAPTMNR